MEVKKGFIITVILALFLIVGGVQATCEPGWKISYYPNQHWTGTPTTTDDSTYIHFADPTAVSYYPADIWAVSDIANWPASVKGFGRFQDYTMTADGYVNIPSAGTYTFTTWSDDGVEVAVDGTTIITNTIDHGPSSNSGALALTAGYHNIVLKYRENLYGTDPTVPGTGNVAVISLLYSVPGAAPVYVPGCHMTSTPAPEFPSAFIPATFIIGMLGAVLLLRRIN